MKVRFLIAFLWIAVTLRAGPQMSPTANNLESKAIVSTSSNAKPTNAKSATSSSASRAKSPIHFRDIARQVGLTTMPRTTTERRYIVDTMSGGGVALFDCNNDGKLDIAVVNDSSIDQYLKGGDLMVTLYQQDSNSATTHFTDVTKSSGLLTKRWATGLAVADFDNDGLPDLYVTGYGHNVLYRNMGGCKFQDVTEKAGLAVGGFSAGAAWADYDRDGYVDLFVARYVSTDIRHLPPPTSFAYKGVLVQLPDVMEGETDFLFRNRGDGTFEDVSAKAGVNDPQKLHGMGVAWGDYDGDGWPDLFVTNDDGYNFLYHNLGNGTFEDVGILSGTAAGDNGQIYGNMAVDYGDFDHDGKLDLFVTRYGRQPASLYRNQGGAPFFDIAPKTGIAAKTFAPVKWGTSFGDFDNDGWPDILMASGNFSSLLDNVPEEPRFAEPIQLFRNQGDRTFGEIADASGLNDGPMESRRGTAVGDINNDGNLDVVVFNVGRPPSLFLNDGRNENHRVLIRLVGVKSNRSAIGARVIVTSPSMTQVDEVRAGSSYLSTSDSRLHFGLGNDAVMKKVEVRWPSGQVQEFHDVKADAIYEVKEGEAIRKISSLPSPPNRTP
ncbi:CRTAC1 family protein [Telmatobacter sp. DSM 110680]|uniref:CRTAC1 family protein n=1 Tax=Telmatobacter sp. DSM 110680 TaxID=3036704 RepID=A0AAU7DMH6_9BACT